VFAVSGLHIGSAFAFCLFLLRRNRIPAPVRFIITASVLLLYGGICGYSASVVRAIITCLVGYGCTLLGVKYDPLESLSLAALIVFTLYPTLVFGVGAQLSFGACLGILLLSKPLRIGMEKCGKAVFQAIRKACKKPPKPQSVDMFRRNTPPKPLWVDALEKVCGFLSVSFAAQIATMPILYNAFGYFSVVSIFLNCLYVPLMSVSFSGLLLLTVLSALIPLAAGVLTYVPNLCINLFMLPFHILELQTGIVAGSGLSTQAVLCYYGGWTFVSDKFHLKKWQKWGTVGMFAVGFVICLIV
jgi:competence protein ComEC